MAQHPGTVENPFSPFNLKKLRARFSTNIATRPGANGPRGGLEQPGRAGVPDIGGPQTAALPPLLQPGTLGGRVVPIAQQIAQRENVRLEAKRQEEQRVQQIIAEQRAQLAARQASEFNPLRRAFSQTLGTELALSQQGAQARQAQRSSRAGLAFSGVGEAGSQFVEAAGQIQFARSLGEFEIQLLTLQQQERAAFDAGGFDFTRNMFALAVQQEFQLQIERFRANVAKDIASQNTFGQIFSAAAAIPFFL